MKYINVYLRLIKNNTNYNFLFFNKSSNFILVLNFNYYAYLKFTKKIYLKLIQNFLFENGFKCILFENWYQFGIKYNFILKLIKL